MKQQSTATKIVIALVMIVGIIGYSAFGQKEGGGRDSFRKENKRGELDSPASRPHNGISDTNNVANLERAMKNLEQEMKRLEQLNERQMEQQLAQMEKMDSEKMTGQLQQAMSEKEINAAGKKVEASASAIEINEMELAINESIINFTKVEMPKLKAEWQKVNDELERDKMIIMVEGEKIRSLVEKSVAEVHENMANTKAEMKVVHQLTNALHADGIINKKKAYKIEVKEGELFIDDKKQPKPVTDKYQHFFKKGNFTITHQPEEWI